MWTPIQLALVREASIGGNSLSAGLEALRKANYAHPGLYNHAFFCLSIGLERKLKLIYVMDHWIENNSPPTDGDLRRIGHDISRLFQNSVDIKRKYSFFTGETAISKNSVEIEIIKFMTRFAKGARYYNLDYITNQNTPQVYIDPIRDWYNCIGTPVFKKHFTARREDRVRRNAELLHARTNAIYQVAFTTEDGTPLRDVFSASYHTGKTEILRKYGTLYTARLCRYLYYILWELRHKCHEVGIMVPFVDELFFPFMNDDNMFLTRKTFRPQSQ